MAQIQVQLLGLSLEIAQNEGSFLKVDPAYVIEKNSPPALSLQAEVAIPKTIIERIVYWSRFYKVSPNLLFDVAMCESRLRPDAWNKSDPKGGAKSIFQFLQPTFDAFSKEMDFKGNVWNVDDNIRVAAWAFANGKESHWTCFTKLAKR